METILKAREESLNGYLALVNGKLFIPYTQRPYEWNKTQISRLFNDILAVYEGQQKQHILNFITIYKNEDGLNIYDGQQRTVSLLIIICALVDRLRKLGNSTAADKIVSEYICKEDWRSTDLIEYKINFQNEETNAFFREYIVNGNTKYDCNNISDYEKHLKENYDLVVKLIDEYKKNIEDNDIIRIIKAMTDKFFVIVLETQSEEVANQMFETLNNTGKKLVDFYVLKNNCIKLIGEEKTSTYWNDIESNTDGLNKSKFLVQFASLFNGKTNEKNAYSALEKNNKLSDAHSVEKTLQEMVQASLTFLELNEPKQRRIGEKRDLSKYEELIEALKIFKAEQYRPVIMAMQLKKYPLSDVNKILSAILKVQIRNFCIAEHKGNTLEKFYPELAKHIYSTDGHISIEEIEEKINQKTINDLEVKDHLRNRTFKTSIENKQVRYILREVYNNMSENEVKISSSVEDVNLEHILPKTPVPESKWFINFTAEERGKYTYLIGNLTLILGRSNSRASNKDFKDKTNIYKESNIAENVAIGNNTNWMKEQIISRTDRLANEIIKVW